MNGLRELLDGYLATRRALGFKLAAPGKALDAFVTWMEEAGEPTIRRDLATAWASQFSRSTVLEYLNYVRQFAAHVAWFAPATEIPILDGRPYGAHRPRPLIFTSDQIDTLLAAAGRLTPQVRAASWQTLLGLLTVTGMRISEARNLDDSDLTPDGSGWQRLGTREGHEVRQVPARPAARDDHDRDQQIPTPSGQDVPGPEDGGGVCRPARLPDRSLDRGEHLSRDTGDGRFGWRPDRVGCQVARLSALVRDNHSDRPHPRRRGRRYDDAGAVGVPRARRPGSDLLVSVEHPGAGSRSC